MERQKERRMDGETDRRTDRERLTERWTAAATVMRVELLGVQPKLELRFPDFGARGVRKPTR